MPRSRLLLPVALTFALAGGCAANEVSFFIVQNQIPVAGGASGICTFSADPSAAHRNEGVLDVALRTNYVLFPLFRSELLSSRDPMAGRAESRGIIVEGAVIELHRGSPTGPTIVDPYTVYFNTFLPPADMGGPGYAVTSFELVRQRDIAGLQMQVCNVQPIEGRAECRGANLSTTQRIIAVIRPFGHTMGGIPIDGATWTFPLTVCCGCLVTFPPDANADEATHAGPDCNAGAPSTQACNIGQDDPVDCRYCSASNSFCQPPGYTPPSATSPCPIP